MVGLPRPFFFRSILVPENYGLPTLLSHYTIQPTTVTFNSYMVWALPCSLATTQGITIVFSSSGYLDVSVRRVPSSPPNRIAPLQRWVTWVHHAGLLHSEIWGSKLMCSSPQLIAAYRVLRRYEASRHPPYALTHLKS